MGRPKDSPSRLARIWRKEKIFRNSPLQGSTLRVNATERVFFFSCFGFGFKERKIDLKSIKKYEVLRSRLDTLKYVVE